MSQRKHDKFILEMKDLIKSLMTFCKPKISIINNEISVFIHDKEILKTLMFFKGCRENAPKSLQVPEFFLLIEARID